MTFSLENLQPESFSNQQTWMDFLTALTEVIEEHIRAPIKQLEDVRYFVEGTDPFILANTIKMLGFDIPADIIKHNTERLSRAIYMLSMFHEISGLDGFERSIEFVLGREVIVRDKWTNNYVDFYTEAQGPLLIDGGDWYKTTHISLGMELVAGDRNLVLPINKTLQDRLLDVYFEFAPINQVVDDFFFIKKVYSQLFISGKVYINPVRRKVFGGGVNPVQQIKARGPLTVFSYKTAQFFADAVFGGSCFDTSYVHFGPAPTALNDAAISALPQVSNDLSQFTINNNSGYLWFASPAELGNVTFTDTNNFAGGWDGASWPADGSIGDEYGPVVVQRTIDGETRNWNVYRTDFPALGNYTFNVSYQYNRDSSCETVTPPVVIPPDPEPPECEVTNVPLYPLFDVELVGINTGSAISSLTQTNSHTNNFSLTLNVQNGYGYLAYPTALGTATFVDNNSFEGGWDGASWADGSTGENPGEHYGPIVVQRDVFGTLVDYYIYRTDFPDIGTFTWTVSFQNPGQSLSVDVEDCPEVDGDCIVSANPRYGSGFELHTSAHIEALTPLSSTGPSNINVVVNTGQYGYFASPAALGKVTFTDSLGIQGGWDGATWSHNSIGNSVGPSLVWRNTNGTLVPWYLYRTDFPALGAATFAVTYERDLDIGESFACDTAYPLASEFVTGTPPLPVNFPIYGTAPIGLDNDYELSQLTNTFTGNANQTFTITVTPGNYGYFAHPSNLGIAHFIDENNFEGGWDGASWPTNGTIGANNGPITILRNIGGTVQTWYLYRTDFPGIGTKQYSVSFGHAEQADGEAIIRVIEPLWSTDRPDLVTIDDVGVATFKRVYTDTIVHITATYGTSSDTIAILLKADMPDVLTMKVLGMDEVLGGHNAIYGLEGHYDDGYVRPVDGAIYSVLSPYARFVNNTLFTDNPPTDTKIFIQARYKNENGIELLATKEVMLKRVVTELHVTNIVINGPSTLQEGASAQYTATVTYSNGSTVQENVVWESSAAGLYINNTGLATAGNPLTNFGAIITAKFQFKGTVYEAIKNVTVTVITLTAVSMQIFGQNTIRELSSGKFTAVITWSTGITTIVQANWTSSRFSISREGVLETGSVGGTTSISIQARAEGLSATKVVTVYNTPVLLEHITIVGPNSVNEGDLTTYRVFAHYSDNKDYEITASLYVENNPPFITITGNTLSFTSSPTSMVELIAVYNDGIREYVARKQIVLVNSVVTLAGLSILGPSEVLESKRIALAAIALYSDGTQDIVEPIWSVRNKDHVNEPEAHADIVSPGVVQGRLVTEDKDVIVIARYFTQFVEYPIIVRDYTPPGPDVPVSYYISGPDEITTSQVGSYALVCKFENCPDEILLSNDWALDAATSVAILDSNGFLRSVNKQPATVNVTATWEYNGHAIQVVKEVDIIDTVFLNSLIINGPATMAEQSSAVFSAEYFYSNETPVSGTGHLPEPGQITWSVTGSALATINAAGVLTMGDVDFNTPLTVTATFNNGSVTLVANLGVLVAGAPPPVVAHNLIGGNTVIEGNQLQFVVEVFRQGMVQTPGTGIIVNVATLQYTVTQGVVVSGTFTAPQVNADTTVTMTITGQYETYPFTITHNILVANRVPTDMLLTGPASITAGQTGQYVGEVFVTGQNPVPGTGSSAGVVYSIQNPPAGITISPTGLVTVSNMVDGGIFITVSATAGTITKTLSVSIQGLPLFNTIKAINHMVLGRLVYRLSPSNYPLAGKAEDIDDDVYLVTSDPANPSANMKFSAYNLLNIQNGAATETPVATIDIPFTRLQYVGTHKKLNTLFTWKKQTTQANEVNNVTAWTRSGNTFTTTEVIPDTNVPVSMNGIVNSWTGPTTTRTDTTVNGLRKMVTADGTELLFVTGGNITTYNGARATYPVARVYKKSGATYTLIQELYDILGFPGTYNYHSSETQYYGGFMLRVSPQNNGNLLDITWQSNPQNFASSRGIRCLYQWDGTKFNLLLQTTSSMYGYFDGTFFTLGNKTFIASYYSQLNITTNLYAIAIVIHEITGNTLTQIQSIPVRVPGSYASAIELLDLKVSRNLMAFVEYPTTDPKGILRIYGINVNGSMALKLSVRVTELGITETINYIREAFFTKDGKTIGVVCDLASGASRIALLRG